MTPNTPTGPDQPRQPGSLGPDNLGRCDICGDTIDVEHADDRLVIATEEHFGYDDPDDDIHISADEAIDAVLRALDRSDNTHDDMLADAIREARGYVAHELCLDKTTLLFGDPAGADVEEELS